MPISALALQAAGKYENLLDATEAAKEAVESAKAYRVFKKLAPLTPKSPLALEGGIELVA